MYEALVAFGGDVLENLQRAKPGSPQFAKARADAPHVIRSLESRSTISIALERPVCPAWRRNAFRRPSGLRSKDSSGLRTPEAPGE
jgi:hypothetical protein